MQEAARLALREAAKLEAGGDLNAAYQRYLAVLEMAPDDAAALEAAGKLAMRVGRASEAVPHFRRLVTIAPGKADNRGVLVQALLTAGDTIAAVEEAERLVAQVPKSSVAFNLLGVGFRRLGRLDDAIAQFRTAISLEPKNLGALMNLGNTQRGKGDRQGALETFRQATKIAPKHAEAHQQVGTVLCEMGDPAEGMKSLNHAVLLDGSNINTLHERAIALFNNARVHEALTDIDKALSLSPGNLRLSSTRAAILRRLGRLEDAKAIYEAILAQFPNDVSTLQRHASLAANGLGDHETANNAYEKALAQRPDDPRISAAYCRSLMNSRYRPEGEFIDQAYAIACPIVDAGPIPIECVTDLEPVFLRTCDFERAAKMPRGDEIIDHLLRTDNIGGLHNRLGRVRTLQDRHDLVTYHRTWGRSVMARSTPLPPRRPESLNGRKLRIGLVSSDLRDHPVTYFTLPIIDFYDRENVEIYCYSFYPSAPDRVQQYIASKVTAFRSMPNSDNKEIADQITADKIDILFELGGSTRFNRLDLMALRSAPVQVSWLGYPHSAGIEAIDRILVDPFIEPDDPALLIEKPFRMAESWVTLGRLFPENVIEPGTPESRAGHFTFGTANNPYKFTPEIFELWARAMHAVPGSHFLFVRPEGGAEAFRKNTQRAFAAHGIAPERVEFAPVRGKHLPFYNKIDVSLDAAPHTGGTTTCESLWMGCPVVTLVGPAFFERLSYSNLSNSGLADLCAHTPDSFVAIAARLAGDHHRRLDLRHGMRERIRRNPLGQPQRWVKNFETAARIAVEEAM